MRIPPLTAHAALGGAAEQYRRPAAGPAAMRDLIVPQGDQACINLLVECMSTCHDDNCQCFCAHLATACGGWPSPPCHLSE